MKTKNILKLSRIFLLTVIVLTAPSCEKHKYCAECWEHKPLITFGGPGDISFCSEDVYMVEDFIYDYESWGWECKLRDY